MKMNSFAICLTLPCLLAVCAPSRAATPPNIVLILADDMGWGDPQCYNAESKVPTPHIDKLAGEGMRFTDAHASAPTCTVSRYSLLTGQVFIRKFWNPEPKGSHGAVIPDGRLTLPGMLKAQGYHTACVGKWHLGYSWKTPGRPNDGILGGPVDRGFDYYYGVITSACQPPFCFIENQDVVGEVEKKTTLTYPGYQGYGKGPLTFNGLGNKDWDPGKTLSVVTDKAVAYLKEPARKKKPFFLYASFPSPHTPLMPSREFVGMSKAGPYGDLCCEVDASVGRILSALDKAGLARDTIVMFSSDHGSPEQAGNGLGKGHETLEAATGHRANAHWRGCKSTAWEGGTRVPFLVRWPGKIRPGTVNNNMACLSDLMATFAAITEYRLPEDAAEDSFNILPEWLGGDGKRPPCRGILLTHCRGDGLCAVREGDWKLIFGHHSGRRPGPKTPKPDATGAMGQLYNLAEDPSETTNLWLRHPEKVKHLTLLFEQMKSQGRTAGMGMNPNKK